MQKILVIDDEVMVLDAIRLIMEDLGYSVSTHSDPAEGIDAALKNDYDLILVDLRIPGRDGAEITGEIMNKKPESKILIITAYSTDKLAKKALENGAAALINKPFEISKILDFIEGE